MSRMYHGPKSQAFLHGSEWTHMDEMDLEELELYERARQGLSRTLYEEES